MTPGGAPVVARHGVGALLLVVVVMAACSSPGRPPPGAAVLAPGPTFLTVTADQSGPSAPAGRICSSTDPVVVQCDVFPLASPALARCPAVGVPTTTAGLPCRTPGLEERLAGWNLTSSPPPGSTSTLRVFLGGTNLREVAEAHDAGTPWATVAVCPRDVTGDGLDDLVVAFRTRERPEVLDVEVIDLVRSALRVDVLAPQHSPAVEGEGCEAPPVRRVRYDPDTKQLELDGDQDGPTSARA